MGAIVHQAVTSRGLEMSAWTLFGGNLAYNLVLCAIIVVVFRGQTQLRHESDPSLTPDRQLRVDSISTLAALAAVAVVSLGFGLSIGFVAFAAAAVLQLAFPRTSEGAERYVAWSVVLLVCGVVTTHRLFAP